MNVTYEDYKKSINRIKEKIAKRKDEEPNYDDLFELASLTKYILEDANVFATKHDFEEMEKYRKLAGNLSEYVRYYADDRRVYVNDQYDELYWLTYKVEAQEHIFDSYMLFLEHKREQKDKFYEPRRNCFTKIGLIEALQGLIDDRYDILSLSLPPGTGKTTIEKFFHSAICGWFPSEFNLFYSHSGDITRMYYDGVLDILSNNDEYAWKDIFPKLKIHSTNAKLEQINIGKYKPFQNVQCTSVGAKNSGKVRASKFLLCDDLIGGIEEALNKNTLDKLWSIYTVDARQRKIDGCKELIIGTRWSVHDHIGRLQRAYEGNDRCKFIAYPDIDPETGESNFLFDTNGFTVEFYHDQELLMDEVTYKCLYKNEPIEREGLLYNEDELRRFTSLPDREPDAIISVCDTKAKGIDFFVMPVMYQYDTDYYMVDCICNNDSDYDVQYEKLISKVSEHNIQSIEIEANMGGDRIAHEISKRLDEINHRCNITTKYTETNKETRIIVNAEWVKKHCLFKIKEDYGLKTEYATFMTQLLSYSVAGRNPHDDVPDALSNFALLVTRGSLAVKAEVFDRLLFGM